MISLKMPPSHPVQNEVKNTITADVLVLIIFINLLFIRLHFLPYNHPETRIK